MGQKKWGYLCWYLPSSVHVSHQASHNVKIRCNLNPCEPHFYCTLLVIWYATVCCCFLNPKISMNKVLGTISTQKVLGFVGLIYDIRWFHNLSSVTSDGKNNSTSFLFPVTIRKNRLLRKFFQSLIVVDNIQCKGMQFFSLKRHLVQLIDILCPVESWRRHQMFA